MTPRVFLAFSCTAVLGLGAILWLHALAWGGQQYPEFEWPIRVSTFVVFGAAYLLTPADLRNRMWPATVSAIPKWALAIVVLFWCYWLASLVYSAMWDVPARGTPEWYRAFTGRFMIGWLLAAVMFFVNSREADA